MSEQLQTVDGVRAGFVGFQDPEGRDGYLASPAGGGRHPGVVLVQEWWGIEPHIQDLARRLAREGFVVVAPDLYHGEVATEPDQALKAMMALDQGRALAEIDAAMAYLHRRPDVAPGKLGMTGFCMGGLLTWKAAERADGKLGAIAPFYGGYYEPTAEGIRNIQAPVLAVWGEKDPSIPAAQREATLALLEQEGIPHEVRVYPAGHAFMNDQHPSHHAPSAKAAFGELVAWFKRHLNA